MNRRQFLTTLTAVAAAPFLPALPVAAPLSPTLMFHKNAFAFAIAPISRFDCLYGFSSIRPEFACHVDGAPLLAGPNYARYLAADAAIQERLSSMV